MNDSSLLKLLSGITFSEKKNIEIPSRFFLAPINTGFAPNGKPNEKFLNFYRERSGKGFGITYIGNVSIGEDYRTNSNTPWLNPYQSEIWKKLSSTIQNNGSLPGIQLACRYSKKKPLKKWTHNNAKEFLDETKKEFLRIPKDVIDQIKERFINAALRAIELGYKVIQIHAAHGYFLAQLLDDRINARSDIYGVHPISFITDLIESINNRNIILDIRLSLYDGLESREVELSRKSKLIEQIIKTGIDMISISNGIYDFNKQFIYPPIEWGHGPFIQDVVPLATKFKNIIFNIAGNIWDPRRIPQNVPNNLSFSIARALIADPSIIKKIMSGNSTEIKWCVRKGSCYYYTRGYTEIYCPFDSNLNTPKRSNCECSSTLKAQQNAQADR